MDVVDDSFKKPGAVPFKWEIKPGAPKQQQQLLSDHHHQAIINQQQPTSSTDSCYDHHNHRRRSLPLKPPAPSGFYSTTPPQDDERQSVSFRSNYKRFDPPADHIGRRPEQVSSRSCFLPKLFRKSNWLKKSSSASYKKPESNEKLRCASDLGTLSRWSNSTRKSLRFSGSSSSTSLSSCKSSPHSVGDSD